MSPHQESGNLDPLDNKYSNKSFIFQSKGPLIIGIVTALIVGFSLLVYVVGFRQFNEQRKENRTVMCLAINDTRDAVTQVLIVARDQSLARPAITDQRRKQIEQFYDKILPLIGPLDCSNYLSGP